MSKSLEGKVALVTGASEGIGFSIAQSLAKKGASIVLIARNQEKLQRAHDQLTSQYGNKHLSISADVGNGEQVHDAVQAAVNKYHSIDILVNNAGSAPLDYLKNISYETIRTTLNTNLFGPLALYKELIPIFERQRHGMVVDMISQAAVRILDQNAVYAPTKAGHRYLSLVMEKELPDIRIYRVYPGVVNTAIWKKDESDLKKIISESHAPALHPDQVGEFISQLIENPSLAKTPDIMLQPREDGSMGTIFLTKEYLETD